MDQKSSYFEQLNRQETDPAMRRTKFFQPFDENKIAETLLEPESYEKDDTAVIQRVYSEQIGDLSYLIYLVDDNNVEQYQFQLNKDNVKLAEIIFKKYENHPNFLLMSHRLVRSQDLGISGSDFLKKSESYIQKLNDFHFTNIKTIFADCSQISVIKWLLKNGYKFQDEQQEEKYEDIIKNPEEYELVTFDHRDGSDTKDEFIIAKDTLNEEPLKSRVYKEGKQNLAVMAYEDMLKLSGLIRLRMFKDI